MLHLSGNSSAPFSWDSARGDSGRGHRLFFPPAAAALPGFFLRTRVLLVSQRELQVPLLRHTGEARLSAQQTPGGHAVHGPQAAARPAETEVPRAPTPPPATHASVPPPSEDVPLAFRFKPVQKFDSCAGENYSGGGQTHPGAAEQTVIAQRQHHQQFLGQRLRRRASRAVLMT